MQKDDRSWDDSQRESVSDESSDSPEPGPVPCMEPFLVRRLSCRTVQLPPLAFRQAEQYYCDRKPEPDTVTVPPRPTTLPLRAPPLIAITSADTTSGCTNICHLLTKKLIVLGTIPALLQLIAFGVLYAQCRFID